MEKYRILYMYCKMLGNIMLGKPNLTHSALSLNFGYVVVIISFFPPFYFVCVHILDLYRRLKWVSSLHSYHVQDNNFYDLFHWWF